MIGDINIPGYPPPVGSTITVKHTGCYNTGTLKNPVFWRVKSEDNISPLPIQVCLQWWHNLRSKNAPTWDIRSTHKIFFDHLAQLSGVEAPSDWYRVTRKDVYNHGGHGLMQYYHNSLFQVRNLSYLKQYYWILLIKFRVWNKCFLIWTWYLGCLIVWNVVFGPTTTIIGELEFIVVHWLRRFFAWLGNQLGYKKWEDWYRITVEDIQSYGGMAMLIGYYNGSPSQALQTVYPQHHWNLCHFKQTPKKIHRLTNVKFSDKEERVYVHQWNHRPKSTIQGQTATIQQNSGGICTPIIVSIIQP